MNARALADLIFLMLARNRSRHAAVLVFGVLLVMLVVSVLFVAQSLQRGLADVLDEQADLVVQRVRGGRSVDLPAAWADGFAAIPGVASAVPRVWGRYFHEPNGAYFTVVGVDVFAEPTSGLLAAVCADLDVRAFLGGEHMIVGSAVRRFLDENHYANTYAFHTPEAERVEVAVLAVMPAAVDLVGADLVLVPDRLARRILGVPAGQATDIVLTVPNALEGDAVMGKVIGQHYDVRVIQRRELAERTANLFHLRSGAFLVLFVIALLAFSLVVYQRYALITGPERREIGVLRASGWNIRQVITLKILESAVIALAAYFLGVILAYVYVFEAGAPLLRSIFVGLDNLSTRFGAAPVVEPGTLGLVFLLFTAPFLAAVLVPVWRIAVIEPHEAMK